MSLSVLLDNAVHKYGERIALEDDNRAVSYRTFGERANRLGQSLLGCGLKPGETIAALMHNAIELVEFDAAAARFGFVRTMLNVRASMDDHEYCLNFAGAQALVFEAAMLERVDEMRERLAHVKTFVCVGGKADWAVNYEELLGKARAQRADNAPARSDLHSIYFTSGTTGRPKAVMLTQDNWINIVSTHLLDINPHISRDDVGLLCAPITHATGSLVLPHLARGARLKILDHFDPERVADICLTRNITSSFMAPTMIQLLMQHMPSGSRNRLNFHTLLYGGAPFPVDRLQGALDTFGPVLAQVYGQWEAPVAFTILQPVEHVDALRNGDSRVLHSCGRAATFAEVAIMDDDGNLLPAGATGEIVTAGGHLMAKYLKNAEATQEIREGKWQRTGDVGDIDEDGFVYITDRKNDMIVTGGNNVYPRQIEEVVYQNADIEEACVIGIADKLWGETVHLVAVRRPGTQTSAESLIEWARDRLPVDRRIRSVEFVESLPKSNYGKILRREIRDAARLRIEKALSESIAPLS
jgi:long-chain acyl-CoA synthetase